MQIVIDKENLIKMFAQTLYVISGGSYDVAKDTVTELVEVIGYTPLPKGHGRLIDADVVTDGFEDNYELCIAVNATPTIIGADNESEE